MEGEFVFLAIVVSASLVINLMVLPYVVQFPVGETTVDAYWRDCDLDEPKPLAFAADCELRQALVDANLWEDG